MKPFTTSTESWENVQVIYIRFRGSYIEYRKNAKRMFNQLFDFATKNNLIDQDMTKVLTIYHDNPYVTSQEQLRTSVAMIVPSNLSIVEEGEISVMCLSGCFAVGHFDIKLNEYEEAWKTMYQTLFDQNTEFEDRAPFELYVNVPPKNFKDTSLVNIYVPIKEEH